MKNRYVVLFLAVMVGICFFLFTSFYDQAKREAIRTVNNEQIIYAKQAARGIENFFNSWTYNLTALSELPRIIDLNERGKQTMEFLYRANRDRIRAITRVDATGKIICSYPFDRKLIGLDISNQPHIREIMRTHQPVVSNVFSTVQGFDAIALHVPVFSNKTYQGSIGIALNFQELARRYIESIKIGETGYAWMISKDGTELYCPVPGHTGHSVFENCKEFPSILVMAKEMLKGNQGVTTYSFDKIRGSEVETVKKHAVYMPIKIGNTFWSIVVASSEDEVIASLKNFRNKLIVVVVSLLLIVVSASYYGLRVNFIIREEKKRQLTEHALRQSEEKYRRITENMSDIVTEEDAHGIIKYTSPSHKQNLGDIPEDVIGRSGFDRVHPDDRERVAAVFREGVLTGKDSEVEYRYRHADGHYVWLRSSGHAIYSPAGESQGTIISSSVITDRKLLELQKDAALEALKEEEEKYRTVISNIKDGVFIIQDGKIQFVNEAFSRITGYTMEDILKLRMDEVVAPEDVATVVENFRSRLAEQRIVKDYEFSVMHKDQKTIVHVSTSAEPIEYHGRTAIMGVLQDITQRKRADEEKQRLEERLQRSEKMEALGTLAGGVAHDLNNVLGVVIGYTELLMMESDKSNPVRTRLTNIIDGGKKAAAIVQDLLTLARRGVTARSVLNLNKVITDAMQSPEFERLLSYHPNVQIRTDLEPDLLNVSGSSVHLGKSLYNLVSNATEAMAKGGVVTIKTASHYLDKPIQGYDQVREGDYVVLTVSDTGEGISEADLKRVFEPFYTKKVMGRSGTGLGLAVVWGTVKDHNGYINVQSEEGKGSLFTLYFPITREDIAAETLPVAISEYTGRGETILVVDDVKLQRDLATAMLQKLNYHVTSASSGEEAVAYLKEHPIDLLVLDMIMEPGMDGLDTYRKVVEVHPRQRAIIVSGFSESDRVHAAQDLGAGAYVRKPYVIEKLGLAVRQELDGK